MSEPLGTLDKDKKAMSEAIKKDIKKDKENLARVEADEEELGYEKDNDKKAESLTKKSLKTKRALTTISFTRKTTELNKSRVHGH